MPAWRPLLIGCVVLFSVTANFAYASDSVERSIHISHEQVLGMLATCDTPQAIVDACPYLKREDIQACLVFARRVVGGERVETAIKAA
jgi:uncharacterized protein (DUF433 family)